MSKELYSFQDNQSNDDLEQIQSYKSSKQQKSLATIQEQKHTDHQKLLTCSTDQTTLVGLPRRTLSPWDEVEGIFGISTHGTCYQGPRVLLIIIGSTWKGKAKVAQSSWTASQNQQLLTTDQATLASPPRREPSPLDDVEGRSGISTHGSSYHDPRALLEVTGGGLKTEPKVAQLKDLRISCCIVLLFYFRRVYSTCLYMTVNDR